VRDCGGHSCIGEHVWNKSELVDFNLPPEEKCPALSCTADVSKMWKSLIQKFPDYELYTPSEKGF